MGALTGKMLIVRIIENNRIDLGQARLTKGQLSPTGFGKGPARLSHLQWFEIEKKN